MISASNTPLNLIQDTDRFSELCERWSSLPFIAIDTEFIRTNTFYPKIGLLQIADHSECYLIDPLHIQDWSCFVDLLAEPKCTFVIHSCGEDLNLLNTSIGNVLIVYSIRRLLPHFLVWDIVLVTKLWSLNY